MLYTGKPLRSLSTLEYAAHKPPHRSSTYNDVTQFPIAAALLRLATTFQVDALRSDVLRRLMLAWPRTLSQWEVREKSVIDADSVYAPRSLLPHPT